MLPSKATLHRLVDGLPSGSVATAQRVLESLQTGDYDPVLVALLTAPLDDEPETDEEHAGVEEARADLAAGRVVSNEDLRRELGG